MCPLGYHGNGFAATHTVGHIMYMMHDLPQSHCGDNRKGTFFS